MICFRHNTLGELRLIARELGSGPVSRLSRPDLEAVVRDCYVRPDGGAGEAARKMTLLAAPGEVAR